MFSLAQILNTLPTGAGLFLLLNGIWHWGYTLRKAVAIKSHNNWWEHPHDKVQL